MQKRADLSVVVPCYNEEERIPKFEKAWESFCGENLFQVFPTVEIIFVDDGSRDSTKKILEETCGRLRKNQVDARFESFSENQGKGAAVRRGFHLSTGEWVLMTDVDLSTPLHELFKLKKAGVDVALGSRALAESQVLKSQSGSRPGLGRLFNRFMRMMTGIPFKDTQCGFKLLRGDVARKIGNAMQENRFAFDVELVLIANQLGASIQEVPVAWAHQEPSRVVVWKDGLQMLGRVFAITKCHGRWRKILPDSVHTTSATDEIKKG